MTERDLLKQKIRQIGGCAHLLRVPPASVKSAETFNLHIDSICDQLQSFKIVAPPVEAPAPEPAEKPKKRKSKAGSDRMERGGEDREE